MARIFSQSVIDLHKEEISQLAELLKIQPAESSADILEDRIWKASLADLDFQLWQVNKGKECRDEIESLLYDLEELQESVLDHKHGFWGDTMELVSDYLTDALGTLAAALGSVEHQEELLLLDRKREIASFRNRYVLDYIDYMREKTGEADK